MRDSNETTAEIKRLLDGTRQTAARLPGGDAIHNNLDEVLAFAVDVGHVFQPIRRAVDAHSPVAACLQRLPQPLVLVADLDILRSEDEQCIRRVSRIIETHRRASLRFGQSRASPHSTSLTLGQNRINHLVGRLGRDRDAALRTVQRAESAPQDSQVVVNFRDRTNRRARSAAGRLLLDGDCGREAVNVFDPRLGHLAEKLPSVTRQRFDVPPLSFGIERVHRERTLAAAARPAEDAHLVARDRQVDVLQVVLSGTADGDEGVTR